MRSIAGPLFVENSPHGRQLKIYEVQGEPKYGGFFNFILGSSYRPVIEYRLEMTKSLVDSVRSRGFDHFDHPELYFRLKYIRGLSYHQNNWPLGSKIYFPAVIEYSWLVRLCLRLVRKPHFKTERVLVEVRVDSQGLAVGSKPIRGHSFTLEEGSYLVLPQLGTYLNPVAASLSA